MKFGFLHVNKTYGENAILQDFSFGLEEEGNYVLTGESGVGKTTVLRLLAGLEAPTSGEVITIPEVGIVFQEDRLCENFSAVANICMIRKDITEKSAREELEKLLPGNVLDQPVFTLSGGMKRRVAIVRACMAHGNAILLDEAFTGLDADNKVRAMQYILHQKRGKILLFTAHDAAEYPFCEEIRLKRCETACRMERLEKVGDVPDEIKS